MNALRFSAISVIVIAWAVAAWMAVAAATSLPGSTSQARTNRSAADECKNSEPRSVAPPADDVSATFAPHALVPIGGVA